MKASDVVTTATQRRESASGIAHTETADAVNTGIVGAADKSASALKGADANDVAQPGKGKGGTGARLARRAVGGALSGSELEGVDNMAYTAYYGAKGAKAAGHAVKGLVERHIGDEESKEAAWAAYEAHKAGRGMRMRRRLGQTARGAVSSALQGSELEHMDDVAYSSYYGAKTAKKGVQKGAQAARRTAAKLKAKQAARTQAKMQAKRHQMEAIARQQTAQNAAKGTAAATSTGTASAGAATSAGGSGTAAAAGGIGCLPIIILALILILIIVASIGGGTTIDDDVQGLDGDEKIVAEFFRDKGLEDVQIAAIMANMYAESDGFRRDRVEYSFSAYSGQSNEFFLKLSDNISCGIGLCQWSYGRRQNLARLAIERGTDWTDLNTQLDFFWDHDIWGAWESEYRITQESPDMQDPIVGAKVSGSKSAFMATTDLHEAVRQFCFGWERPGVPHLTKRYTKADEYLAALQSSGSGQDLASASERQQQVVSIARSEPPTAANMCGQWVSFVFNKVPGVGYVGGNACDMYDRWCTSSNKADLKVGMIVADSRHADGGGAGETYGHVGIYVGDGRVLSNEGGVITDKSLDEFISYYGTWVPVKWGWANGVDLSAS